MEKGLTYPARNERRTNGSLPRAGLDEKTAQKVAEILHKISDVSAVTITDTEKVLAYIGIMCEHHPSVGEKIVTPVAQEVLRSGKTLVVHNRSGLGCNKSSRECPLESTVVAPLKLGGAIIGTVKLYHPAKAGIPSYVLKLAEGAAQLLSMQIEIAGKDRLEQLMIEAQLEALQAKINPHFLFNALSTISMQIRTNPERARELLLNFAAFFRSSLKRSSHFITLEQELDNVHNYLVLEKARFRDKLRTEINIAPGLSDISIPTLCIQPLVENAIIHGISPKEGNGTVQVSIRPKGNDKITISIKDDGLGISPEIMPKVKEQFFSSGSGSGVGLYNVDKRLRMLCGEESQLNIKSKPGIGTNVRFTIKRVKHNGEIHHEIKSTNHRR